MSKDCCDKAGAIIDAECCYDEGKFFMRLSQGCLPGLFTLRFTAPADYTAGDVVVVKGKELPVRTPGMTAATTDIFKAGAVIHCDIDLDRELAFFWQGGGNGIGAGVLPNLSYEEQFAGFYDIDGNKVYVKSIDFGPLINQKLVPYEIANYKDLVDLRYTAGSFATGTPDYTFDIASQSIRFRCSWSGSSAYSALVTIYYTCTDR